MGFQTVGEQKAGSVGELNSTPAAPGSSNKDQEVVVAAVPAPSNIAVNEQETARLVSSLVAEVPCAYPTTQTQAAQPEVRKQPTDCKYPTTASAPIPIPSPTKSQSTTNLNNAAYCPPHPAAFPRVDAHKVVGNLKHVGDSIRKNCKKSKEGMNSLLSYLP